jgi:hypothetical protein
MVARVQVMAEYQEEMDKDMDCMGGVMIEVGHTAAVAVMAEFQ